MSRKSTTLPPVQPAITEPAALPPVTFSPEKLAELLNMLTDQKEELAALKEQMVESNKRKMDTYAKALWGGILTGLVGGDWVPPRSPHASAFTRARTTMRTVRSSARVRHKNKP